MRRSDTARACRQGKRGRHPEDCGDCDLQGMRVPLLTLCEGAKGGRRAEWSSSELRASLARSFLLA